MPGRAALAALAARALARCPVQRNAGGRPGLSEAYRAVDAASELAAAVAGLLEARRVGVVTGFVIRDAEGGPAPETDGPPGACALAGALERMGKDVRLFTEDACLAALRAAASARGLGRGAGGGAGEGPQVLSPSSPGFAAALDGRDCLVFVEKVGPGADGVPRSMRGLDVGEFTSPAFAEACARAPPPRGPFVIGVADGGNEIGCGRFPAAFSQVRPPEIVCAVPAHALVLCDTSNYGAHLLGALAARAWADALPAPPPDRGELLRAIAPDEERVVAACVGAGAVDGVRARRCLSVDGLDFGEYLGLVRGIWEEALLGGPGGPGGGAPAASPPRPRAQ